MALKQSTTAKERLRARASGLPQEGIPRWKLGADYGLGSKERLWAAVNGANGGRGSSARDRLRIKAAQLPRLSETSIGERAQPYRRKSAQHTDESSVSVTTHVDDRD